MKKTCLMLSIAALAFAACTKKTTNTTIMIEPKPAYIVSGVHDVSIIKGSYGYYGYGVSMPLSVEYNDSTQYLVSLSLSPLPAGVVIDTTWTISGFPTFTTTLTFYDTTDPGAVTGTYPVTLTATSIAGKKTYPFNLKVLPQPPCTGAIVGKYNSCYGCSSYYSDSIYADPSISNKIWFANFNNSGNKVYGTVNCSSMSITIPTQTISGITYYGSGYAGYGHYVSGYFYTGSTYCSVSMN